MTTYLRFPKLNHCPGCGATVNKCDCTKCGWTQPAPGQCPTIPNTPRMSNLLEDIIDDLTLQAAPGDEGVWDACCDTELTRIIYDEVRRVCCGVPPMSDRLAMLLSSKLGYTPQFWFDLNKKSERLQDAWRRKQVENRQRRQRQEILRFLREEPQPQPTQFTCAWWVTAGITAVLVLIWLWAMWVTAK